VAEGSDLCTARLGTLKVDHEGSPRLKVLDPPRKHKNVQGFEDKVLVVDMRRNILTMWPIVIHVA
jgi:hypothetical protein